MGGAQAGGDCVLKLPFGPRNANSGPRRSPLSLPKISLSDDFRVFRASSWQFFELMTISRDCPKTMIWRMLIYQAL